MKENERQVGLKIGAINFMETIKELRNICQPSEYKSKKYFFYESPARIFSIYATRFLLQKNISSIQMTTAILVVGAGACFLLLSGSFFLVLIGALILGLWSILRCAADEVRVYRRFYDKARVEEKSNFGLTAIYADTILLYMMQLLMPLCLSFSVFKLTDESLWLIAGMGTALFQTLLLVMHHAQESALLRKINHERKNFILRKPSEESASKGSEKLSLVQQLISAVNRNLLYPALGNWLLLFCACTFFLSDSVYLKLFLILIGSGSAIIAFYIILRKLKNSDADKQFIQLFSSSEEIVPPKPSV